jgi:hypothetical protein
MALLQVSVTVSHRPASASAGSRIGERGNHVLLSKPRQTETVLEK